MPGLTSTTLVWALAAVAVVLLGAVVWGWPKLARPGPRSVALRVVALCLVQASLLSLVFVLINQAGEFYSSWSDLLGRYTGGGALHALREGKADGSARLTVTASAPVSVRDSVRSGGVLQT